MSTTTVTSATPTSRTGTTSRYPGDRVSAGLCARRAGVIDYTLSRT